MRNSNYPNVQLNSNAILAAAGDNVPLNDLGSVYEQAMNIKLRREQAQKIDEENRNRQIMGEAYRNSLRPDGTIDENMLQSNLAQSGAGAAIPGVRKANLELQKTQAEVDDKRSSTDKNVQDIFMKSMRAMDDTMASLAVRPDLNENMVYGEIGRLVNMGAMDLQAKHKGVTPDQLAKEFLSTMPVGNPQALKTWIIQQGARAADATKRLEMSVPKYDEQDRGGVINQGTIDQFTGKRTAGTGADVVTKTNTPGEVLSAQTSRRGQDLVNARSKEFNEITQAAGNGQIVETPQGYAVIDKGTAISRPVMTDGNQPVLGKDNAAAKNASMARTMGSIIPEVRSILQAGPTGSYAGAKIDDILGSVGQSTKGADLATKLEVASGWMASNVPRFEGPQSNADTQTYRTMAGDVGDRNLPVDRRLAALATVESLMEKYAGKPGTSPATTIAPRPLAPVGYAPRGGAGPGAGGVGDPAGRSRPPIDAFFAR